jgi:hypothetical protein
MFMSNRIVVFLIALAAASAARADEAFFRRCEVERRAARSTVTRTARRTTRRA